MKTEERVSLDTPVGRLQIVLESGALTRILWANEPQGTDTLGPSRAAKRAQKQLSEYFAGRRQKFELELDPRGTEFQCRVWHELGQIPFGETRSYGDVAKTLGKPTASRAVGAANGKNPIPIILACHRVIGASGALTGFAGGLDTKRWLLDHESAS
ncbi:MAG: methylated-DNA--[protein]-cysteine S-methyltransferase [Polyangiaceae bacterium]|nr:methylated-DNA--[protein]-cysteine S-methyltransferase [Polyangiaceae bacterium]